MTPREAVVAEARAWLLTPFHHRARRRGAGVDCANLLIAVYHAVGLIPDIDPSYYPPDWHLHRDEPRFVDELLKHADPLAPSAPPLPGDVVMYRYGRHAAHGAIVEAWPIVIHAWRDVGFVTRTEAHTGPLAARFAGFYRIRGID